MPNLEFEFYLATKLGMTVAQLREQMSSDEFTAWRIYYDRHRQRLELASKGSK